MCPTMGTRIDYHAIPLFDSTLYHFYATSSAGFASVTSSTTHTIGVSILMLFDNVVQYTLKHGGGTFTIDGDTFNPVSGFAVGGFAPVRTIGIGSFDTMGVSDYANARVDKLLEPGLFLGTWLNDDVVHLDIVAVVSSESVGKAAAKGLNQRAIYDFKRSRDIWLTE
jgi:hypothetical protein